MPEKMQKNDEEILSAESLAQIKRDLEEIENIKHTINEKLTEVIKCHDELKRKLDSINVESADTITKLKSSADEIVSGINKEYEAVKVILTESVKTKEQVNADSQTINKIATQMDTTFQSANTSFEKIKNLMAISDATESKVKEYQNTLTEMKKQYEEYVNQIQGLLPGATSTGLASAFGQRKDKYKKTIRWWTIARFVSITLFFIYGCIVYKDIAEVLSRMETTAFSTLFKTWTAWLFNKSPIILGLVLLEEFSRRTYNKFFKLEEHYAYKQILSQSFEGYKNQLLTLGKDQTANTALNNLCENTIKSISESPLGLIKEEKESGSKWFFQTLKKKEKITEENQE